MATADDIAIGNMTGIYPLPGVSDDPLHADMAAKAAVREISTLPTTYSRIPQAVQYAARMGLHRPVGDAEYDQMFRHDALINRLQAIESNSPKAYREYYRRTGNVPNPYELREMERPPTKYRPVNPVSYPGASIGEGLAAWDTTVSLPVNAVRMAYGADDAADKFASAANAALLRIPEFVRSGTFYPGRDAYEQMLGSFKFDDPQMMKYGRADSNEFTANPELVSRLDDTGSTSTLDVMEDFGVPNNLATRGVSVVLDGLIDPDSAGLRAISAAATGRLGRAAAETAVDNALPLTIWGAAEAPTAAREAADARDYWRAKFDSAMGRSASR